MLKAKLQEGVLGRVFRWLLPMKPHYCLGSTEPWKELVRATRHYFLADNGYRFPALFHNPATLPTFKSGPKIDPRTPTLTKVLHSFNLPEAPATESDFRAKAGSRIRPQGEHLVSEEEQL